MLVLHTVLAERNVARAAERLHVTPSAVSNALARLRAGMNDPLVTRKGRGIVPTPRAMELDRKSTRLNSSHQIISYAVFCLKKKNRRLRERDKRPAPPAVRCESRSRTPTAP